MPHLALSLQRLDTLSLSPTTALSDYYYYYALRFVTQCYHQVLSGTTKDNIFRVLRYLLGVFDAQ